MNKIQTSIQILFKLHVFAKVNYMKRYLFNPLLRLLKTTQRKIEWHRRGRMRFVYAYRRAQIAVRLFDLYSMRVYLRLAALANLVSRTQPSAGRRSWWDVGPFRSRHFSSTEGMVSSVRLATTTTTMSQPQQPPCRSNGFVGQRTSSVAVVPDADRRRNRILINV